MHDPPTFVLKTAELTLRILSKKMGKPMIYQGYGA